MRTDVVIEQVAAPVTWRLRREVLYPDGSLKDVMIDDDFDAYHFGAYLDNKLVGVISLFRDSAERFQFRKFAVHPDQQGQGIGHDLLVHLLAFAKTLGARKVWCNARQHAIGFYERFGLHPVGDVFIRNGLSYVRMESAR